jgi:hypothetical protein
MSDVTVRGRGSTPEPIHQDKLIKTMVNIARDSMDCILLPWHIDAVKKDWSPTTWIAS